jgi:hypothetical protein
MSPNDLLSLIGVAGLFVATAFIMFKALSVRKVLVDATYRSRALWTAIGASSLVLLVIAGYVSSVDSGTTVTAILAGATIWGLVFLALYGWIYSNVNVAIGADFFNRDVLFWKRGLRVIAPVLIIFGYVVDNFPYGPGSIPDYLGNILVGISTWLFYIIIAYSAAILIITYRRIADRRIKRYTLLVAWSILSLFVLVLVSFSSVLLVVAAIAWIYFMYSTADSLTIKTRNLSTA